MLTIIITLSKLFKNSVSMFCGLNSAENNLVIPKLGAKFNLATPQQHLL